MFNINSRHVRVYLVAAMIPLTLWSAKRLNVSLKPPAVDMPKWTFAQMPKQLGEWQGEDELDMDPKIANATEAKVDTIVNRKYRDDKGHVVAMHTAMFDDPKGGVYHSPLTCYRSQGWEKLSETQRNLEINDELSIPVSVTVWQQKNEKKMVVYWYQLGKHVLFNRWDLGLKVRWSLAGKPTWPALIKVMLDIPMTTSQDDTESAVLNLAERVAKWENQPSRRNGKGMLGIEGSGADSKSTAPP
jgi:EpsI family protein